MEAAPPKDSPDHDWAGYDLVVVGSGFYGLTVAEHQDIGPCESRAVFAFRQRAGRAEERFIQRDLSSGGIPDVASAVLGALQVMNGAVTFTPNVCCHSSSVTSANGFTTAIPALFTRTSIGS